MRSRGSDAVIAVATAAFLTIIVPLQSFIGNCSHYPYPWWRLSLELGVLCVGLATGLFAFLRLLGRFLRGGLQSILVGLLVCAYLESGILSEGLPAINGGVIPELSSAVRQGVDLAVWISLVLGFAICTRWLYPVLHWVAAAVLLLGALSLFDVRRDLDRRTGDAEELAGTALSGGERVNQMTVVANVKYSPTRNVLVFILDSLPSTSAEAALAHDDRLRGKFAGFTAYSKNIGMHDCTKRGVPGLVTGHYYDPSEMSQSEYPLTMYGSNSFVTAYCAAGAHVAFSPDLLGYGYTNLPIERRIERNDRRGRDVMAILRRSRAVPYLCLFDIVVFRICPFVAKGPILYAKIRHAVRGRHSDSDFWGEASMYPSLASAPIDSDPRTFLGLFHSWGVHPPWPVDLRTSVADKLSRLGDLLDAYRARGILDRSLVIVTADHGLDEAPPTDGYPPSAAATLWVKPEGARGAFATCGTKTSHARIAPLLKAACGRTLTADEITGLLHDEERLYRFERPDKRGFDEVRRR